MGCVLSRFSCVHLCVTPCTVACQLLCLWDSPRQEYWSGLPCPPPGDLPNPGIDLMVSPVSSASQADSLQMSHLGSPFVGYESIISDDLC